MERFILGQETCGACGATSFVIVRTGAVTARFEECDACGAPACQVERWFPASYWPQVERLVAFDEARQRLHLGTLEQGLMH